MAGSANGLYDWYWGSAEGYAATFEGGGPGGASKVSKSGKLDVLGSAVGRAGITGAKRLTGSAYWVCCCCGGGGGYALFCEGFGLGVAVPADLLAARTAR